MATAAAHRPTTTEFAPYYARYVDRVPEGDVVATLEAQLADTRALLGAVPESRGDHRYAPGKWSVKEVVGHVADAERIFAYRALRIARGDETPLPGFEQDGYVPAGEFGARTLADLAAELTDVRRATLALLRGLPAAAWERRGTASGMGVSVRALAYIIAGHERHHMDIVRERYLG